MQVDRIEIFRNRLEEIYNANKKNPDFFEEIGIKKDNFRKLFGEGSNPVIKTVFRIAEAAGVTPGWLLGEPDTAQLNKRIDSLSAEAERREGDMKSAEQQAKFLQELLAAKQEVVESYKNRLADKDEQIASLNRQIESLNGSISALIKAQPSTPQNEIPQKGASRMERKPSL